ncbi:MAG: transaldolase [bacterium]
MAESSTSRLIDLYEKYGQSPWLDNLRRSYITTGQLERYLEMGVRGLTSNPTIFQKAIQDSSDYDEQLSELAHHHLSVTDTYWALVLKDIADAADIFAHLFQKSNGQDGQVSVEVDPHLSYDEHATIQAAIELRERLTAPNVLIKIPATKNGLIAIEDLVSQGFSINVTLIFSLERYIEVLEAYVSGLETLATRLPEKVKDVVGVASFFISRVDAVVDTELSALDTDISRKYAGRAAILQAQMAYLHFLSVQQSQRWKKLEQIGAHLQRPLWASTSTKNPLYRDTLYVDELIGRNTVNTIPEDTMLAFYDHGVASQSLDEMSINTPGLWKEFLSTGIDLQSISHKLEADGVRSFEHSFDVLLEALQVKIENIHAR